MIVRLRSVRLRVERRRDLNRFNPAATDRELGMCACWRIARDSQRCSRLA